MANLKEELIRLYENKSKHSNYQVLPKQLEPILGRSTLHTTTRYERERLAYILDHVDVAGKSVLDVGGNTGFFSFELLGAGAASALVYEGNKEHCEFVALAAKASGLENLKVINGYYEFAADSMEHYDVAVVLNVLHHLGDDYGNRRLAISDAKKSIVEQLNNMRTVAPTIVFQLGFNWHGNPETPLFDKGTKAEMIEFITEGVSGYWNVKAIGIAEKHEDRIVYRNLNDGNIARDDTLGEFLNRPLFILTTESP